MIRLLLFTVALSVLPLEVDAEAKSLRTGELIQPNSIGKADSYSAFQHSGSGTLSPEVCPQSSKPKNRQSRILRFAF
jgi:hypothetical protein